jgi:hypothetical protein
MSRKRGGPPFGIDVDVLHTTDSVLVRIYYLNTLGVKVPYSEIRLSVGSVFLDLYDAFQREYHFPDVEDIETRLNVDRSSITEPERNELASRDLAEMLRVWLVMKGRGMAV